MSDINSDLRKYSEKGNLETVKALIKIGADINAKDNLGGYNSLMKASFQGHGEVLQTLIENGADVNSRDNRGRTSLMLAAIQGHKDIVKTLLIDYQVKVSDEDKSKLKDIGSTYTLDLIDKREFEKSLHREIKPIQEQTKKKSVSFKL